MSVAQIGLQITQPKLDLKIKPPDMEMHTQPPDLALHITNPEVIIDLRESFNSMGLMDIGATTEVFIDDAKQTVIEGIERRAKEGDLLGKAHGPTPAQLAARDAQPEEKPMAIGLMPSVPPKITAKLGAVEGDYSQGDIQVKLNRGVVKGIFTWGRVHAYIERPSDVDIKA